MTIFIKGFIFLLWDFSLWRRFLLRQILLREIDKGQFLMIKGFLIRMFLWGIFINGDLSVNDFIMTSIFIIINIMKFIRDLILLILIVILLLIKINNLTSQNLWIEKNRWLLLSIFPFCSLFSTRINNIDSLIHDPFLPFIATPPPDDSSPVCWCDFGGLNDTCLDGMFLPFWSERLLRHRCSWMPFAAGKCLIADLYLLWRLCVFELRLPRYCWSKWDNLAVQVYHVWVLYPECGIEDVIIVNVWRRWRLPSSGDDDERWASLPRRERSDWL